jgi:hypothetical protein
VMTSTVAPCTNCGTAVDTGEMTTTPGVPPAPAAPAAPASPSDAAPPSA